MYLVAYYFCYAYYLLVDIYIYIYTSVYIYIYFDWPESFLHNQGTAAFGLWKCYHVLWKVLATSGGRVGCLGATLGLENHGPRVE